MKFNFIETMLTGIEKNENYFPVFHMYKINNYHRESYHNKMIIN